MKKYNEFTKSNLSDVRDQIKIKLAELKELGLNIEIGTINFNDVSFTTKLTCTIESAGDMYAIEFKRLSRLNDMRETDIGRTFVKQGKTFVFRGFKPNARTKKAIYEDINNNDLYACDVNMIKIYLSNLGTLGTLSTKGI